MIHLPAFFYRVAKFRKLYFLLFLCIYGCIICVSLPAFAQSPQTELIETQFKNWRKNNFQEKIYVHTDKATYVAGEICWFKIYNVDGYNHQPVALSKVAYVEILDKSNRAVLQGKIALDKGLGNGSFYLPATLLTGNYKLRAYTNWMKNYGADYFFEKKIALINPEKSNAENSNATKTLYDIGFFPEGGNLVSGLENKIGFKVNNQFGRGVDFEGWLLTEKGDTVKAFRPAKFGMGNFIFTPQPGTRYKAVITLPGGLHQAMLLPAVDDAGYNMRLERTDNGQVKISVYTNEPANGYPVTLFAQTRYVVKKVSQNTIEKGEAEFLIPDSVLGDGVSQFTVFNSRQQPVCERLYFKKPHQVLQIAAQTDQSATGLRKKITVDITSRREDGATALANMSMAVYKIDSVVDQDECSIANYLLLSSDITGTIESPDYYFSANSDAAAADNLMLTQGWRKFKWKDTEQSAGAAFRFLPEVYGHIISGKIVPLRTGLPVKDIAAYLTVPGVRTQFQTAIADEHSRIKFDMKELYSDGDIMVQTNNEKDSGYRVEIDTPFFNNFSQRKLAEFSPAERNAQLLNRYISSQVQNAYLYNQLNHSSVVLDDTAAFYAKPNGQYLLDNYVRFTTMEEVFREYVTEVNVRKHGGKFSLPVLNEGGQTYFTTQPLVLLDGLPVFDIDKIMTYDPLKVRKLDVVTSKYFLRDNTFSGIINLTTYKGDLEAFEIDPRATIINYEGLQLQRDFYSPTYATADQQQSRMPDFRNLLFWSPELNTNASGKANTSFYTSDVSGKYAVVIEGMTKDGRLGQQTIYFDVNK